MSILLHLSPELEAKLGEQAKASGKAPEEVALELLQEQLGNDWHANSELSSEQWVSDIRSWALSHQTLPQEIDDSRESIYAGREA